MSEAVENQRLISAMTKLARQRDERSRKAMYMAMLRANFYIPTEPSADDSGETQFVKGDPLQGHDVYVAFTSEAALQRWRPGHLTPTRMVGLDLFPMLSGVRPGSVLINPGNDVGGELYRNEIAILADAVPQYKAWLASQSL